MIAIIDAMDMPRTSTTCKASKRSRTKASKRYIDSPRTGGSPLFDPTKDFMMPGA